MTSENHHGVLTWPASPAARKLTPVHLGLVAIVVSEYDPAIRFFTDVLGFELVEDSPP